MEQKILVVEDNELNLKLFCDLLRAHGYVTEPVRDGHPLSRAAPPEVRVHDPWIQPPHPLVDTPLSAPDRGLCPVEGGDCRIELSATFPWLPRGMAVRL